MGSSASKATKGTIRKFPNRPAGVPTTPTPRASPAPAATRASPAPTKAPKRAPTVKDEAIRIDAMDPTPPTDAAFADRLRQIGAVRPHPTLSHSSTVNSSSSPSPTTAPLYPTTTHPSIAQNPTLSALAARRRLEELADREFAAMGSADFAGRELVSAADLRDILAMRSRGVADADIEMRLRLRPGLVARLGPRGMVEVLV